jgi:outer membrane cobalamin receptor
MELGLDTRPFEVLDLRASYSLLDSQDLSGGDGAAGLQYRPRHRVTLDSRWALHRRASARMAVQYVADQVYFSRGTPAVRAQAGNYVLTDVSATAMVKRLEVTLRAANVFDQLYEQSYGLPREGRSVRLIVGARF